MNREKLVALLLTHEPCCVRTGAAEQLADALRLAAQVEALDDTDGGSS